MTLRRVSDDVYVSDDPVVKLGGAEVDFLKNLVQASPRKRVRICAHQQNTDLLHEMLIAIAKESYIRPHKHLSKSESFHIVEGNVDIAIFDDSGQLRDVVELGPPGSGRHFYYRMSKPFFHTLRIHSDLLLVHETTNGPFDAEQSVFAPFAPDESDKAAARAYATRVSDSVGAFLARRTSDQAHG